MKFFDRQPLWAQLTTEGLDAKFADRRRVWEMRLDSAAHGDIAKWEAAWHALPCPSGCPLDASSRAVRVAGPLRKADGEAIGQDRLRETLMYFHPWRKGPFEFFGQWIDTEWRSDWKWDRLAPHIDPRGKRVLDVGCGNGYYGWRMLAAGADWILGCDPYLRYIAQFEVLRRYAPAEERHFVIPLADSELPTQLRYFDMTFSLGVLYHRTSPIDHLLELAGTLRPGGELVLETLIVDTHQPNVLMPERRYAKMRNVWFIPSLAMLQLWLQRTGFDEIQVLDVTTTTTSEQRSTEWMTFQSLQDFLDPEDASLTLEGYPAPVRAILHARLQN